MPNDETLIVEEVPAPSGAAPTSGAGIGWLQGISLRQAIEVLKGYEGELTNPATGVQHAITLAAFEGRDLDSTFVRIAFRFVDPRKVGTKRSTA